jgi:FixJ family two-component response regulator
MSIAPEPVIVVDDDAAVRNSLKFALELEGFDVRVFESGLATLADESLSAGGCLVVDQYMPGMTGIELVDRLRERYVDIPAILITAKASDELRLSAALRGIRQVLEKPLEDGALLEGIRSAIASARAPREGVGAKAIRDTP